MILVYIFYFNLPSTVKLMLKSRRWKQGDDEIFSDVVTTMMAFRLLREHGYDVSSGLQLHFLSAENQSHYSAILYPTPCYIYPIITYSSAAARTMIHVQSQKQLPPQYEHQKFLLPYQ